MPVECGQPGLTKRNASSRGRGPKNSTFPLHRSGGTAAILLRRAVCFLWAQYGDENTSLSPSAWNRLGPVVTSASQSHVLGGIGQIDAGTHIAGSSKTGFIAVGGHRHRARCLQERRWILCGNSVSLCGTLRFVDFFAYVRALVVQPVKVCLLTDIS